PGRGPRLPDDPPAGPGRAGDVRHAGAGELAAALEADSAWLDPGGAGQPEAGRQDGHTDLLATALGLDARQKPGHAVQRLADRPGAAGAELAPAAAPRP